MTIFMFFMQTLKPFFLYYFLGLQQSVQTMIADDPSPRTSPHLSDFLHCNTDGSDVLNMLLTSFPKYHILDILRSASQTAAKYSWDQDIKECHTFRTYICFGCFSSNINLFLSCLFIFTGFIRRSDRGFLHISYETFKFRTNYTLTTPMNVVYIFI